MATPVVSSTTPAGPLVEKNGYGTYAFVKWLQQLGSVANAGFDAAGNYQGNIGVLATVNGRKTLASIVQYIDDGGVVTGPGIDFARPYVNKDTDHIADGIGSPLAGGRKAFSALVATVPVDGNTLRFNGIDWATVPIAITKVAVANQFLTAYNDTIGIFSSAQPAFANLSGSATAAQVPALSALTGQITSAQLPPGAFSGVIVTAALTGLGLQGSITVVNGQITAVVPAT